MLFGQNKMPWRGSVTDWCRDAFKGGTGTPIITYHDMALPAWQGRAPLRVAMLSDFHIGCPAMTLDRLETLVERVNAEKPDLILLIGDYSNKDKWNGHYVPPEEFAPVLARLTAEYGVHFVCGNHDNEDGRIEIRQALTQAGLNLLENEAVKIARPGQNNDFWLVGLPDELTDTIDLKAAFEKVTTPDLVLVMCHNPLTALRVGNRAALTMSGHNHAGQVRIPFVGAIYLPPGSTPLHHAYGHIREHGQDSFTGPGLGTSNLPVRLWCPAGVPIMAIR